MKGIILAGGTGSRLWPLTLAVSKQLMPVYDKPMIYFPISTLMLAGIREIAIITDPKTKTTFKELLGDGSQWGVDFTYIEQPVPDGLPSAYILSEHFLNDEPSMMILGDNLFAGPGLGSALMKNTDLRVGAKILAYQVANPQNYGVIEFSGNSISNLVEKPEVTNSSWVIPGLYFCDGTASARAKELKPSARKELEIVDFLKGYLNSNELEYEKLLRGSVWLDTGNPEDLFAAAEYVRVIEQRQGIKISCPEEIAWRNKWITTEQLSRIAEKLSNSTYGQYLRMILVSDD
jgi:glucose-1-phosphate thymidylyltransferase